MVGFRGGGDVVVGAITPLELVVACASTACGALVLANPGRLASEQGRQLTQKTSGQFTKMGMAAAAVDTGDLHQGSTRGDFECHRIGRSFEAGDQGPDMTEGGLRGVEQADAPSEAGAFIGIAHPAWAQLTIEDGRAIDAAHAVEIYNHGCAVENDRGDGWYLLDQLLTEGKRLTAFATDDAHFKGPDYFGGWVHVKAESLDPDALLDSLKKGLYYSSMGPQIHAIEMNGKEISIACSPVDTITVVCGTSRSAVRTGRAITDASFDLSRLEKGWLLKKTSPWFRVTVIDGAGKRAWSNPIWWDELR